VSHRTLRASEVSQFVFCRRAWWYARQGAHSSNLDIQAQGTAWHESHGRSVLAVGCLRALGWVFLGSGLVAGVAYLTSRIVG
jgi:hypothetical protein